MRQEVWRTGDGQKAMVLVQDDETVTVSIDVLRSLFERLGWQEMD